MTKEEIINGLYDIKNWKCRGDAKTREILEGAIAALEQTRPLTDIEQRIFLAAMGREEKVCKEVDKEYEDCQDPRNNDLVKVCREITRKVKGALWNA